MSECIVCKSAIQEGSGACPLCNFPVLWGVENSETEKEQVVNMGKLFLKKMLNDYEFGLREYEYDLENDVMKFEGEKEVLFTNNGEFPMKVEHEFYNKELGSEIEIRFFIEHSSGNKKTYDLKVKNPNVEGSLHLWLEMTKELKVRLKLGNETKFEVSQEVSMLEAKG